MEKERGDPGNSSELSGMLSLYFSLFPSLFVPLPLSPLSLILGVSVVCPSGLYEAEVTSLDLTKALTSP